MHFAESYHKADEQVLAKENAQKALQLFEELGKRDKLIDSWLLLGNIALSRRAPAEAKNWCAQALELSAPVSLQQLSSVDPQHFVFSGAGLSQKNIPVKLMYQPGPEGELFLVWDLVIHEFGSQHWWSARVDALNGIMRDVNDWVIHCEFPDHADHPHSHGPEEVQTANSLVFGSKFFKFFGNIFHKIPFLLN